jgi:hypothetical protein
MKELLDHKVVFWLSLTMLFFFTFLFLNFYVFHLSFVAISVVQEMLTIPFMLLEIFLLIVSIKTLVSNQLSRRSYTFFSVAILVVCILMTWGGFFILWEPLLTPFLKNKILVNFF